jgi:CBS domain containing-hemolysin-like protein
MNDPSAPPSTPPSSQAPHAAAPNTDNDDDSSFVGSLRDWVRGLRRGRNGEGLRETLEELIEEQATDADSSISAHERALIANVLALRTLTAEDVMVPRADIVALEADTGREELLQLMRTQPRSRLPVYRGTLDDALGMVHIKDLIVGLASDKAFKLNSYIRDVLFIAPSMRVNDLLLEMRRQRTHMALVVDEFGGIDGLVTIEDVVEELVGEIEDEHDIAEGPKLSREPDGSMLADARASLEDYEAIVGPVFTAEEREEIDTLGGLVYALAGRIPGRGEVIAHPGGIEFTVLDADPRRIKRLRVRQLPAAEAAPAADPAAAGNGG